MLLSDLLLFYPNSAATYLWAAFQLGYLTKWEFDRLISQGGVSMNREQWLQEMVSLVRPIFTRAGATVPAVRVSVGFPSKRAISKRNQVIGECWPSTLTEDGVGQVFISPLINQGTRAADVLVHELVHAALGPDAGHKGEFKRLALAVGLEGKMTATIASEELTTQLQALIEQLGPYPHGALKPGAGLDKKQTTRLLKVQCPEDDYTVRVTQKWLEVGYPVCPCGAEMVSAEGG